MKMYLLPLLLVVAHTTLSQPLKGDTTFLTRAQANQVQKYNRLIGGNSRLYNGTEYRDYISHGDEHPYFGTDDWAPGSIEYDDVFYPNVDLFYDLSKDAVIVEHTPTGEKIELIAEKISRFTMGDHSFVRLRTDSAGIIETGFYEVLSVGTVTLYAHHQKTPGSRAESGEIIYYFGTLDKLYLYSDGVYHRIKSKGSVSSLLRDHKKELASWRKSNRALLKGNREKAITAMVVEYNRLAR
jgi:hypothetical protein